MPTALIAVFSSGGITEEKVILVVSDNGANMLKVIRIIQEEHTKTDERGEVEEGDQVTHEASEDENDDDTVDDGCDEEQLELELPRVPFRQIPCLAHTLKLIVKAAYVHYDPLIVKTRHLVSLIRKSSVAIEKLIDRCGKSVVTDCTTRWSSTFYMIHVIGTRQSYPLCIRRAMFILPRTTDQYHSPV